jgi:mycoredoxin-dependent peroxiredoxin
VSISVGSLAPPFALRDAFGRTVEVPGAPIATAQLIVFFPQVFTPTCAEELRVLDAHRALFDARGVSVRAVSVDSMATLRAYVERENIGVTVLSDFWPHGAVASSYGVFLSDRGWADRVSFLIDQSGTVSAIARGTDAEPRVGSVHLDMLDSL